MPAETSISEWVVRIRAEYMEMPGLALTRSQMRRLWLLDAHTCDRVVDDLLKAGFLFCRPDLTYARADQRIV